eukprot:TRINITY_DN3051_c0_g1_i1.p1 TRINITY_DN3051_c0_g1~~TRINITY_DN3051_c0_g1_i1.p1  ORF type:complete len:126 (-),score=29.76 TRINITY_DN3051_c0_g1_i1:457-834(-)
MSWKGGTRSRDGLSSRGALFGDREEQLQLRVDPIGDLDDEIHGLRGKVGRLKDIASRIGEEAKEQNTIIANLEATMAKAQMALKDTMKKLNRSMKESGSTHLVLVIVFALFCFFLVYLWAKFFGR